MEFNARPDLGDKSQRIKVYLPVIVFALLGLAGLVCLLPSILLFQPEELFVLRGFLTGLCAFLVYLSIIWVLGFRMFRKRKKESLTQPQALIRVDDEGIAYHYKNGAGGLVYFAWANIARIRLREEGFFIRSRQRGHMGISWPVDLEQAARLRRMIASHEGEIVIEG